MGDRSSIEWTDATWPIVNGCRRVSAGCGTGTAGGCYAERLVATRLAHQPKYAGLAKMTERGPRWTGESRLWEPHLDLPLRWKRPRRIFVANMGDLFFEGVPDSDIDRVFAVMALASRHTFQVLTKRPERMRAYLSGAADFRLLERLSADGRVNDEIIHLAHAVTRGGLPNVWLGVSVEDQATANARIPLLLQTPAAVRFVSYEPALGPVVFRPSWMAGYDYDGRGCSKRSAPRLDQVIVGGESGPGARPFDVAWARFPIAQCKEAGVACFVKQLGARPWDSAGLDAHSRAWPDDNRTIRGEPTDGDLAAMKRFVDACAVPGIRDRKGGDPSEWPEDLRVREFPR